jgi:hypothetical protein
MAVCAAAPGMPLVRAAGATGPRGPGSRLRCLWPCQGFNKSSRSGQGPRDARSRATASGAWTIPHLPPSLHESLDSPRRWNLVALQSALEMGALIGVPHGVLLIAESFFRGFGKLDCAELVVHGPSLGYFRLILQRFYG